MKKFLISLGIGALLSWLISLVVSLQPYMASITFLALVVMVMIIQHQVSNNKRRRNRTFMGQPVRDFNKPAEHDELLDSNESGPY